MITVIDAPCGAGKTSFIIQKLKNEDFINNPVIYITPYLNEVKRIKDIFEVTDGRLTPNWMEADHEAFKVTVKNLPTREEIDVPVDEMLIVELYSK